jgi:hypothetical protein
MASNSKSSSKPEPKLENITLNGAGSVTECDGVDSQLSAKVTCSYDMAGGQAKQKSGLILIVDVSCFSFAHALSLSRLLFKIHTIPCYIYIFVEIRIDGRLFHTSSRSGIVVCSRESLRTRRSRSVSVRALECIDQFCCYTVV